MNWRERFGQTIDLALLLLVAAAMLGLFLALLVVPVRGYAASCLTIDVPPQAVLGVKDGDTFTVFNLLPPGSVSIRVEGANTPEISRKKGVPDEPGAQEARQFAAAWLAKGTFQLSTCGKHTFERIVGVVSRNGERLADALKAAGHSR